MAIGGLHTCLCKWNAAFRPSFFKSWTPSRGCVGGAEWEACTMSHAKQVSKRRNRTKAVTVLGVAGALSLTGGTSGAAVGPKVDMAEREYGAGNYSRRGRNLRRQPGDLLCVRQRKRRSASSKLTS